MDTTSLVLELLKQRGAITPLEQDILDTYHELSKNPFDMKSAHQQVQKNDANHLDICIQISVLPTTVTKPLQAITEEDIKYNLSCQLSMLTGKEWDMLQHGQ